MKPMGKITPAIEIPSISSIIRYLTSTGHKTSLNFLLLKAKITVRSEAIKDSKNNSRHIEPLTQQEACDHRLRPSRGLSQ
jgi:hypothetical protein